ncbi:DUF4166 domain-containing protein [uncultured Roseibium sp.]|uniref:DUF4166 domain-containing protein n=1 Tax=uncultured Roseibium sp. TaxID=1936171 RepID=UPI003216DD65
MQRTLYQSILGDAFAQLPEEIRYMHTYAREATGTANVRRGTSWAARLIGSLAALPDTATDVPVRTSFAPLENGERWTRRFAEDPFQTDMIAGTEEPYPCMRERLGPFLFKMRVSVRPDGLDLDPESIHLGPLRLPGFLAPKAYGRERVVDGKYSFSVKVIFPLIGTVLEYEGRLTPSITVSDAPPPQRD